MKHFLTTDVSKLFCLKLYLNMFLLIFNHIEPEYVFIDFYTHWRFTQAYIYRVNEGHTWPQIIKTTSLLNSPTMKPLT